MRDMVTLESIYKVSLETELKRYPKLRVEDISEIREWLTTQSYLPSMLDVQIGHFLHASYYDVNVTKTTIEHFYQYKNSMKEFFSGWDPKETSLFDYASKVIYAAFLPKQSPTDCQVVLMRLKDSTVDLYSFDLGVKWLLMSFTCFILQEGQQSEFKIVYDANSFTMSHVFRNPLSSVRNYINFGQKASAVRVVEIHFINSGHVIKKLVNIIRPFMSKKIMQMMYFHATEDVFFKTMPSELTPSDYGGSGPSMEVLHNENVERVLSMREALMLYSLQRLDETNKPGKKVEKEFRKLEID